MLSAGATFHQGARTVMYRTVMYRTVVLENHPGTGSVLILFSVVDPDPPGPAFIWLSWIRIRIGNVDLDPDPGAWKLTKICK